MNNDWPRIRPRKRLIECGAAKVQYEDFCVDCGMMGGKRVMYFRGSKKEAEALAAELRKDRKDLGSLAADLSPADKLDAVKALAILQAKTTLETAATYYLANHRDSASKTVLEVQNELIQAQQDRKNRESSIRATKTQYASFLGQYGDVQVASITSETCHKYITERDFSSDTTKANAIRYLSVFFNFAVKRGYIAKSPMDAVERPKAKYSVPEFIPVAGVEGILRCSEKSDTSLTSRLAAGFFSGIRPTELSKLLPSDIDLAAKVIHVRPEVAKTGRPRHVTISDNLAAWLAKYPFDVSNNFDERRAKVCKEAGVDKWPADAMRHTFATMHVAAFQNPEQTAFQMGHEGSTKMLRRHYLGLASREDAERYWQIMPEGEK